MELKVEIVVEVEVVVKVEVHKGEEKEKKRKREDKKSHQFPSRVIQRKIWGTKAAYPAPGFQASGPACLGSFFK